MVFVLVNSDLNDPILGSKALDRSDKNRCLKLLYLINNNWFWVTTVSRNGRSLGEEILSLELKHCSLTQIHTGRKFSKLSIEPHILE